MAILMAKKQPRAPPKPASSRQVNLWMSRDTVRVLDLLAKKWSGEGKIPLSRSAAVDYMVKNFRELARLSPSGGAILPLNPIRRNRLALIATAFATVGAGRDESDLEAVGCMIDYLYELFQEETFLDRFIVSRGRARP